ncbi:hypothetical protein ZHAS_00009988 [Anopheles sinensis]|uniref:Uncharacterized protein n=1 Tax=Anopheles sinensis TaxID=74873 RepID=A0A084VWF9_ANOSI|nr:hypothetical protein ZHAS_00009988 [Anopheles sinensis]
MSSSWLITNVRSCKRMHETGESTQAEKIRSPFECREVRSIPAIQSRAVSVGGKNYKPFPTVRHGKPRGWDAGG